jgi:hypothetical protein
VVIAAVDDGDIDGQAGEAFGCMQTREAPADDDDTRTARRLLIVEGIAELGHPILPHLSRCRKSVIGIKICRLVESAT